jgi:hypothetical protein
LSIHLSVVQRFANSMSMTLRHAAALALVSLCGVNSGCASIGYYTRIDSKGQAQCCLHQEGMATVAAKCWNLDDLPGKYNGYKVCNANTVSGVAPACDGPYVCRNAFGTMRWNEYPNQEAPSK